MDRNEIEKAIEVGKEEYEYTRVGPLTPFGEKYCKGLEVLISLAETVEGVSGVMPDKKSSYLNTPYRPEEKDIGLYCEAYNQARQDCINAISSILVGLEDYIEPMVTYFRDSIVRKEQDDRQFVYDLSKAIANAIRDKFKDNK